MVVDLHRLLDQAVVDVRGLEVLDVRQPLGERQAVSVALGLSGYVQIGSSLKSFARTGDLGVTEAWGEQSDCERRPSESETIHRKSSWYCTRVCVPRTRVHNLETAS